MHVGPMYKVFVCMTAAFSLCIYVFIYVFMY